MNGKKLYVRGRLYKGFDTDFWDGLKREEERVNALTDEEFEAEWKAATRTDEEFLDDLEHGRFGSWDFSESPEELRVRLRKEIAKNS